MSAYSEKLKDPRWQKKRLEILERDGWECTECGDTKSTLHVHHRSYRGSNPWETPDFALTTLCELCHDREHDLSSYRDHLAFVVRGLFSANDCKALCEHIEYVTENGYFDSDIRDAIYQALEGMAISVDLEKLRANEERGREVVQGVSKEGMQGGGVQGN